MSDQDTKSRTEMRPRRAFLAAAGAGVAGLGFTVIAPGLHLMAVATDYDKCIDCHICADVCPTGYIQMGLGE